MSEHQKKIVTRWFEEVWNQNRSESIEELLPTDCVIHDGASDIRGPEEFRRYSATLRDQFTDVQVTPQQVISEGELTYLRWSVTMRHTATDKTVHSTGMSLVRFHEGVIVEAWQNWDQHGVTQQLAST
jgi:predicted SnoaL-like aldol condensation-catalyzing enzyme